MLNVTFIRAPSSAWLKVDVPLVFRGDDVSPGLKKGMLKNLSCDLLLFHAKLVFHFIFTDIGFHIILVKCYVCSNQLLFLAIFSSKSANCRQLLLHSLSSSIFWCDVDQRVLVSSIFILLIHFYLIEPKLFVASCLYKSIMDMC